MLFWAAFFLWSCISASEWIFGTSPFYRESYSTIPGLWIRVAWGSPFQWLRWFFFFPCTLSIHKHGLGTEDELGEDIKGQCPGYPGILGAGPRAGNAWAGLSAQRETESCHKGEKGPWRQGTVWDCQHWKSEGIAKRHWSTALQAFYSFLSLAYYSS